MRSHGNGRWRLVGSLGSSLKLNRCHAFETGGSENKTAPSVFASVSYIGCHAPKGQPHEDSSRLLSIDKTGLCVRSNRIYSDVLRYQPVQMTCPRCRASLEPLREVIGCTPTPIGNMQSSIQSEDNRIWQAFRYWILDASRIVGFPLFAAEPFL